MNPIATTSVSEIVVCIVCLLGAAIVLTLLRSFGVEDQVSRLTRLAAPSGQLPADPTTARRVIRKHYQSVQGILISLLPATTLVLAMTIISLLRDHGYDIVWVPLFVAWGTIILAASLSFRLRDRVLLGALADGHVDAGGGSLAGEK